MTLVANIFRWVLSWGMRMPAVLLLSLSAIVSYSQSQKVPHKMNFAGMKLNIREGARLEIQKDVDALTKNAYYFNKKVERAKSYFPIIERIFEEERLPDDFKFLALQESALISDAVSTSNAVGYWQFKDFTAEEMGMRVDKKIDERMNLVSATRGAARYLKQNNFYFNNWICALQAYQMGAGGAKRVLENHYNGLKRMDITKKTYWYVKKFLAHKIAFQHAVKGTPEQPLGIHEVRAKTSLKKIANELSIDLNELKRHNKWAKTAMIPDDKQYAILIPGGATNLNPRAIATVAIPAPDTPQKKVRVLPQPTGASTQVLTINQLPAITARKGEQLAAIANRAGIKLSAFIRYNDISASHHAVPGLPYFLAKKKNIAKTAFHKVGQGETAWAISQRYGIRLKNLKKYNNLSNDEDISPGAILWLSGITPDKAGGGNNLDYVVELDRQQLFDWGEVRVESSGN